MATIKVASLSVMAMLAATASAEPVYVNSVAALTNAVATAGNGATIVLRAIGSPYKFTDEWMDASGTVKSMLKINASNVTIEGEDSSSRKTWTTGSEPVIIDANGLGRVVYVVSRKTGVTFKNITFTGGSASGDYGGGVYGNDDKTLPVCTNCVLRGNTATKVGAAAFYCILQDCLVVNNISHVALYAGKASKCDISGSPNGVAQVTSLYDCSVSGNVVPANGASLVWGGGTYSNCVFHHNSADRYIVNDAKLIIDCTFKDNTNKWSSATLFSGVAATNCTFRRNYAEGATSHFMQTFSSLHCCTSEYNRAGNAGLYLNAAVTAFVSCCSFVSNSAPWYGSSSPGYGGAIRLKREPDKLCHVTVTNCTFIGNSAYHTGGAIYATNAVPGESPWAACTVVDSTFASNSSQRAAGVYGVRAVGCTFDGNMRLSPGEGNTFGNAAAMSCLELCDINDAALSGCVVDRCRIHDVPNTVNCVFSDWIRCTNSLVEGCEMKPNSGSLYCIRNYGPMDAEFVNCTFTTNVMFTYFQGSINTATNGLRFVNCIFNGNIDAESRVTDIGARKNSNKDPSFLDYVSFTNSYYGRFTWCSAMNFDDLAAKTNMPNTLASCEDPKFVGRDAGLSAKYPAEPFWALSYRSPLIGKGKVSSFTDSDLDLAGRLRLRDGMVDVGCYQCWLNPNGFSIILK